MKKIAVVLMNLGGPDKLENVEKFLYNLFSDRAIINLPNPLRWLIAKIISKRRVNTAKEIYEHLGGGSPIFAETLAQKHALEIKLADSVHEFNVFIAMRYFHPYSSEVVKELEKYNFDEIILLPLYPHFSTSTTESSINDFMNQLKINNINIRVKSLCCYPQEENFLKAHSGLILETYSKVKDKSKVRLIFSAHGLPEKIIKSGDSYQWQIEQTVDAIVSELKIDNLDYIISYQSKVGPMKWLEPATDREILKASKDNISVVVIPIAFTSEHSETLVELDIEYRKLAEENGISEYLRVPTLSVNEFYIESLAKMCDKLANQESNKELTNFSDKLVKICPEKFCKCINNYE